MQIGDIEMVGLSDGELAMDTNWYVNIDWEQHADMLGDDGSSTSRSAAISCAPAVGRSCSTREWDRGPTTSAPAGSCLPSSRPPE